MTFLNPKGAEVMTFLNPKGVEVMTFFNNLNYVPRWTLVVQSI